MTRETAPPLATTFGSIVDYARLAPSVHNTQPWSWRARRHRLELRLDGARRLEVADPTGRGAWISCGAALHHARVAARALGWQADVERVPVGGDPLLVARLTLRPQAPPKDAAQRLMDLLERKTDRRRFTSWPVPDSRMERLAQIAETQGADAIALLDVSQRFKVDLLVSRAQVAQARDRVLGAEQAEWIDRGGRDGLLSPGLPKQPAAWSRFRSGTLDDTQRDVETTDQLIVLGGATDEPKAWVRSGEALSALWLHATRGGLSVVPLSQLIDVAETREALEHDVLAGAMIPQIMARIGWQAIGRAELPRSPRRPLSEVLR